MKEITKDNYKNLEFNFEGIVVGVPKIDLYFNADLYFIKQKIDYDTNKRYYITCGYNQEDETCNGLSPDRLETILENTFNCFSQMNYYQFDDMKEFCEWYLHKDDKLNESINKFIESVKDSPFKSVELPEKIKDKFTQDIIINHYKVDDKNINNLYPPQIKRKDKYRDLIEYIELYVKWALMSKEPNKTLGEIKPVYDKIQEWLEGEIDD